MVRATRGHSPGRGRPLPAGGGVPRSSHISPSPGRRNPEDGSATSPRPGGPGDSGPRPPGRPVPAAPLPPELGASLASGQAPAVQRSRGLRPARAGAPLRVRRWPRTAPRRLPSSLARPLARGSLWRSTRPPPARRSLRSLAAAHVTPRAPGRLAGGSASGARLIGRRRASRPRPAAGRASPAAR